MSYVGLHELSPETIRVSRGSRFLPYVQPAGALLNLVVMAGLLYATITDQWAESAELHFGLWRVCRYSENHQEGSNCTYLNSATASIHACRVFMISSCLLSALSLTCAGHGLFSKDSKKFYVASGFLFIADLLVVVTTVTFTVCYFHRFTISNGVIVAWVMVPVALAAIMLYLCGCGPVRRHLPLLGNGNYKGYGCVYHKSGFGMREQRKADSA